MSVSECMLHWFTQCIRHCLHLNQNKVSKRAVCRPYWYERGGGVNIVLFYFGKPFMNVRVKCAYVNYSYTRTPNYGRDLVYFIYRGKGRVWLSEKSIIWLTGFRTKTSSVEIRHLDPYTTRPKLCHNKTLRKSHTELRRPRHDVTILTTWSTCKLRIPLCSQWKPTDASRFYVRTNISCCGLYRYNLYRTPLSRFVQPWPYFHCLLFPM